MNQLKSEFALRWLTGSCAALAMSLCAFEYGTEPTKWARSWHDFEEEDYLSILQPVRIALPQPAQTERPKARPQAALPPHPVPDPITPSPEPEVDYIEPEPETAPESPIYTFIDTVFEGYLLDRIPRFPGGDAELYRFLSRHVNYPSYAKTRNIEGTVYIRFVVDSRGFVNPNRIEILESPDASLSEEVMRVLKLMPLWEAGMKDGMPRAGTFTMPLTFRMP